MAIYAGASSSGGDTSAAPFVDDSSVFAAADAVIRAHYTRRNAFAASQAMSSTMGMTALHLSSTSAPR
jgi:hypothetical protein